MVGALEHHLVVVDELHMSTQKIVMQQKTLVNPSRIGRPPMQGSSTDQCRIQRRLTQSSPLMYGHTLNKLHQHQQDKKKTKNSTGQGTFVAGGHGQLIW